MNISTNLRTAAGRIGQIGRGLTAALLGIGLATAGSVALAQPASATGGHGANGSVKIDGVPVDSDPSNEPHVDCAFSLQFFGFDEGTNNAEVTFYAWSPTASSDEPVLEALKGETSFTFEGGRPPGNTLNHTETYELNLDDLEPNAKGEVHVKVDVTVTDAGGKEFHKHKVFWTSTCEPEPSPTPTVTPTSPESPEPTVTPTPTPTDVATSPAPAPTGFDGGVTASGNGSGPGPFGWLAIAGGIALLAAALVRLAKSWRESARGA